MPRPELVAKVAAAIANADKSVVPVSYDVLATAAVEAVVKYILEG